MTSPDNLPAVLTKYKTKGGKHNLRAKTAQGVPLAVECLDLKTGKVESFNTITEAAFYLKNYCDSDKPSVNSISMHVRTKRPVPYYGHLWRAQNHVSKPWPDYSHLDISQVRNGVAKTRYPVYILNMKTSEIYKCSDFDSVVKIVDILLRDLITYLKKGHVYRRLYRFSYTKKGLFEEKVRKPKKLYIYHLFDTIRNQEYSFDTAKSTAKHLRISTPLIIMKFSHHKSDVIYVGDENRYKITRVPR